MKKMIKRISCFVAILILSSCGNLAFEHSIKYNALFREHYELIDNNIFPTYIKNKKFRKISKYLKKKYDAKLVRLILLFESESIYYCEFLNSNNNFDCLVFDTDFNLISEKNIHMDY
ncbi:hypothetical protein [Aureivirga marina]|uniref:hypothetical protein n=1 Tax=Aureivirga marina TaxID=1182451 RepID=UPI0018CABC84|nr:hypothetical protein [Aureivirga marina]